MAITARDLAQVDALGLRLVAGADAADREISWAHAIELADPVPYLSGGELVMTTGINLGADAAAQFAYVQRLASAGVTALAIDTGTTIAAVPSGIRRAADQLDIPVLEVPPSTPFIAITRVVIDAIRADELRSVQRVVDLQQVLARATLRSGIPGVVAALADCLSATVVVTGTDETVLAAAGPAQDELTALLAEAVPGGARRTGGFVTFHGGAYISVAGLRAAQSVRGHLAVRTPEPLSNSDRLLVAHAVSLISIAVEKPARVVDAEQRLRTAVTRALLTAQETVDRGVLRYFGFEPAADVVVAVLHAPGPVLEVEVSLGGVLEFGGPYLMTRGDDEIVVVVPAAAARRRIRTATEALSGRFPPGPTGGVSSPVALADIGTGVQQARTAAHGAAGRAVREFADLGVYGVLLGGRTHDELCLLATLLDPLTGNADELVDTLAAYLRHHGQLEAAAAELGIHRHTMRNRIRRIGELLDDDLDSVDLRMQLWLALQARRLLADQPPRPGGALR